jgi:methylated-DNA-[protein]-cysteine S-methyltransferase
MKKNPFPLFVPCHRVIRKNGIGGFNYGIKWKKFLIEFEK